MAEFHALHVEEENISWGTAFRIETRVGGHYQKFNTVIEDILTGPGVGETMKNYPISIRIWYRKSDELSETVFKN